MTIRRLIAQRNVPPPESGAPTSSISIRTTKPFSIRTNSSSTWGRSIPSTHGVLRVILKLDGEKVLGTECVIGYLHRGVEKIAENRTYTMFNPYVDRMDYVAAVSNGLGYCQAVEKLLNVEAPPRAKYIRVILTELNRIASHQLWLGTHALDIGAMTPLFYTFRDREEILKIFEKYCGARLTTHAFRIGGCQYETYDGLRKGSQELLKFSRPRSTSTKSCSPPIASGWSAPRASAYLSRRTAIALGVTGPVLRASGVKWDMRRAQPYANYSDFDFEIPIGENGDTYDRYLVRMIEMRQSVRIIRAGREWHSCGPDHGQGAQGDQAAGRARSITRSKLPRASWDISSSATARRSLIACACVRRRL